MRTILLGVLLATGLQAGQVTSSTEVPYPTQWSRPQVLPDGRVVPAVPTRFQTREVGVRLQPKVTVTTPVRRVPGTNVIAFLVAAGQGDTNSVRGLLAQGVDVNGTDANDATALMVAAANGRLDVVRLLLANGAEVNEVTRDGRTALIYATQQNQRPVVQALLGAGADKKVMDQAGKMAADYALAGNFKDVSALLNGEPVPEQ